MQNNILVIGGTGKTGSRVAGRLQALGHNVRIGSRSARPAFEWGNPSSYTDAIRGMDFAYITYYPDLAVPGSREAIKALTDVAVVEGLKKVVLLSGKGEREAEACEQIVANSGLNYTIVRASWFNQNFSESFLLEPIQAGVVSLPMADRKIPFVDAEDIAEVAVDVMMDSTFDGQTITVTGPAKLTFREAVSLIAKATNREIRFQSISIDEYTTAMRSMGLPEDYVWLVAYLFREVLGNADNQKVYHDVEKVLGRPASSFDAYIEQTAMSGIWTHDVSPAFV